MQIRLSMFSKYRQELMGLATIFVCVFHYFSVFDYYDVNRNIISEALFSFFGSVGVDIFLLISGIGIFYSLQKDHNILSFFMRRIKRMLPAVTIISGLFWIAHDLFIEKGGLVELIRDFFGISFWLNGVYRFWYIHLSIVLYMISPFIVYTSKKTKVAILFLSLLFPFVLFACNEELFWHIEIALCRIPIYIVGLLMGEAIKDNKKISRLQLSILLLLTIIMEGLRFFHFRIFRRYAQSALAIILCYLFVMLAEKHGIWLKMLRVIGTISLEVYLIQVSLIWFCVNCWNINLTHVFSYIVLMVATFILSGITHWITYLINKENRITKY